MSDAAVARSADPPADLHSRGRQIRLIACDLDGTLLRSDQSLSPATLRIAHELARRDIHLTIASGRIYTMLPIYTRALEIDIPIISSNGAIVIHPESGETAMDTRLDLAAAAGILRIAYAHALDVSILAPELCLFTPTSRRMHNFERYNQASHVAGLPPMPLERLDAALDAEAAIARMKRLAVSKLLVYQPSAASLAALEAAVAAAPSLMLLQSDHGLYEILPAGTSKGAALLALARHLGLERDAVMAFGDFDNDLDMLAAAGFGVAMANAIPAVQAVADYITLSNDDDGVAAAIEAFVL